MQSETVGDAMVGLALICLGVGVAAVNTTPALRAHSAHVAEVDHADSLHLTPQEKRDVAAFMRALTDTSRISARD